MNSVNLETKRTIVLGASPNPARYSYRAVNSLKRSGYEAIPIGIRDGQIEGIEIIKGTPEFEDVHTVTLYVGPKRQPQYYDYILALNPNRVIFNPGTENPEFIRILRENNIETEIACTLVLLASSQY